MDVKHLPTDLHVLFSDILQVQFMVIIWVAILNFQKKLKPGFMGLTTLSHFTEKKRKIVIAFCIFKYFILSLFFS